MSDSKHTALPWKVVSEPNFDNGNVYTSIQPVNVDEEAMKPLAMMSGEFHVCRMSHTAAPWRFYYHRANAAFIVEACNSYYTMREAIASKDAEIALLREAMQEACDLLTERTYGSPARSPGHNARVTLEWAMKGGAA